MNNSIGSDAYILVTEAVAKELSFSPFPTHKAYEETVIDIGPCGLFEYFPKKFGLDRVNVEPNAWSKRNLGGLRLLFGWIYATLKKGRAKFHNLPS
jgi:hypothetical protein